MEQCHVALEGKMAAIPTTHAHTVQVQCNAKGPGHMLWPVYPQT